METYETIDCYNTLRIEFQAAMNALLEARETGCNQTVSFFFR